MRTVQSFGPARFAVKRGDFAGRERDAEIANVRTYEYKIERIGGSAMVCVVRFNQWLAALRQGRRLARTVGALAIVIALPCLGLARMVCARSGAKPGRDV